MPSLSILLGARIAVATLAISVVSVPFAGAAEAGLTKPFTPDKTVALSPGITFQRGTAKTTGGRKQSIRVVSVESEHPLVRLRSVLSNGKVVKRDLVRTMALKQRKTGWEPMAATNGDLSTRNRVDAYAAPQSMAVSRGELLLAQACTRPTLGIDADGEAHIGEVRAHIEVNLPGRQVRKPIHRMNTHRDDGNVVIFTRRFANSTRTASGGVEVVVSLEEKVRPNGEQRVKVLKVRKGGGNTQLEWGKAVISVKNSSKNRWVYDLKVGDTMNLYTTVVRKVDKRCGGTIQPAGAFSEIVEAVGGNHFTARNGKVAAPSAAEHPAGSQRHPRTNVGLTADGRVLMVAIDGRRAGAAGMTLADAGRLMLSLGAKHSINLDGGGSTVMARYMPSDGSFKVANKPSDGRQRPATQALVAFEYTP